VSGTNIHINQYKNLSVSKCGSPVSGLISASYAFTRNVNSIYTIGKRKSIAAYGELPDINVSYSAYSQSFEAEEANGFSKIDIKAKNGGVSADYAVLTQFSFELSVDSFLSVTKTFTGYSKPSSGGGSGSSGNPLIIKRQDFSGSLPPGISGNYLQKVSGEVSIGRQTIPQFATRKPYASVVNFPITRSITYEAITDEMDSITIDDLEEACRNPTSLRHNVGVSACGFSFSIDKAFVTAINYGGGDATSPGDFQTVSITYTSYEDIPGIKPVILLEDESC
jgi:hypothetical protein